MTGSRPSCQADPRVYDGGIVPDPEGIVTGGDENKTARMISFHPGDSSTSPP